MNWFKACGRLLVLSLISLPVFASPDATAVEKLLAQNEAPHGVVFEIAVRDERALLWAIPRIRQYIKRLKAKFPQTDIAVVSHGKEQFALQKEKTGEYQELHDSVQNLVREDGVPVHICSTHASWRGVQPEDFPEYVSVATTGPQQVKDYVELGYVLVKVKKE